MCIEALITIFHRNNVFLYVFMLVLHFFQSRNYERKREISLSILSRDESEVGDQSTSKNPRINIICVFIIKSGTETVQSWSLFLILILAWIMA